MASQARVETDRHQTSCECDHRSCKAHLVRPGSVLVRRRCPQRTAFAAPPACGQQEPDSACSSNHALRNAAQQHVRQAASPVRAHDNQVGSGRPRLVDDPVECRTVSDLGTDGHTSRIRSSGDRRQSRPRVRIQLVPYLLRVADVHLRAAREWLLDDVHQVHSGLHGGRERDSVLERAVRPWAEICRNENLPNLRGHVSLQISVSSLSASRAATAAFRANCVPRSWDCDVDEHDQKWPACLCGPNSRWVENRPLTSFIAFRGPEAHLNSCELGRSTRRCAARTHGVLPRNGPCRSIRINPRACEFVRSDLRKNCTSRYRSLAASLLWLGPSSAAESVDRPST